jgi:DNA-binding transcriptional ArsR family regulator
MNDLHTLARTLASKSRLEIILLILKSKEDLCVQEIAEKVSLTHSATSHQLAKLESVGLVESHRMGQTICYTEKDSPLTSKLRKIINII